MEVALTNAFSVQAISNEMQVKDVSHSVSVSVSPENIVCQTPSKQRKNMEREITRVENLMIAELVKVSNEIIY